MNAEATVPARVEEELRASLSRLEALIEHLQAGILVEEESRCIVHVNAELCTMFGMSDLPQDLIGTSCSQATQQVKHLFAEPEVFVERVEELLRERQAVTGEELCLADGRVFERDYIPIRDDDKHRGNLWQYRDITERKLAERKLVERARQAALGEDIGAAVIGGGGQREVLQRCAEAVVRHLDAAFAPIWRLDEEEHALRLVASAGVYTHTDGPHSRVRMGQYKIGLIAAERLLHLTNAVLDDPRISDKEWARREGMVAFAGYPLTVEDRLVGVMAMFSREPLAESTLAVLASVADKIALAIDRERVERAEAALVSIVESSGDAIISATLDGTIRSWNAAAERLYGYSADEMIGRSASILVPPDRASELPVRLEQLRREGRVELFDTVRLTKDGRLIDVSTTISPIRDPSGEIVGVSTIIRDITERRQAEEALAQSEARYRAVVDTALDAIVVADADGTIRSFNRGAKRIFGYTADEAVGQPLTLLMPDRFRKPHVEGLRRYLETGEARVMGRTLEVHGQRKDGAEFPIELTIAKVDGGNQTLFTSIIRDITERKRAEEEARLLRSVGLAVGEAEDLQDALTAVLRMVCEATGWAIGQVWIPTEAGTMLHSSSAWHTESLGLEGFRAASESLAFAPGVGLPGRAWSTRQPVWVRDITVESGFPRARMAAQAGLKAGMAIPVLAESEVVAVLDFFTLEQREEDDWLLALISAVAAQLGPVIRRKEAEEALRRSEERFRSLVRNSSDMIVVLDANATIRYISPAVERVLGWEPEEMVGASTYGFVHPQDIARAWSFLRGVMDTRSVSSSIELRLLHRDGTWRHVEAVGSNLMEDPSVCGLVFNLRDTTERKAFEEQLRHQAFHDSLTGLPNRALFMDRLEHALVRATRDNQSVAVLYLDMDRFKFVNDSLGHDAGNQLLVAIARRLRDCVRPEDTVARLGGDELVVLLEDIAALGEAERVAERIEEALRPAFEVDGHEVVLTTSIGLAVSAAGERDPEELLRAADIAMYKAKQRGKARYEVFHSGMDSRALELLELEGDLRRAIDRGEFRLHYQPKVELATGRIAGVEALVRWEHPERGLVSPLEFIGLAEETGLILPIERWVLREACSQAVQWQEQHSLDPSFEMCVNVSARHFQHPELLAEVAGVLSETGLAPHHLMLEITESAVMEDAESNTTTLQELKALGVRLAIDDFGTGYSSLSYLHRFPVDVLKIDRSFVDGLGEESEDTAIVGAVIGLAHSLRLEVIAEGVETQEQARRLQALGCRLGQGYLFSRPLAPDEVKELLAAGRRVVEPPSL